MMVPMAMSLVGLLMLAASAKDISRPSASSALSYSDSAAAGDRPDPTEPPPGPEALTPCSDGDLDCDYGDGEFDGDEVAGLAAEPSLLQWGIDQFYTAKTFMKAVTNKLETPDYHVIRAEQAYEVREYPASRWVCTNQQTAGFFSSTDDADVFRRLFRYFSGKNGAGARMTLTSPLLLRRDTQYAGAGQKYDACLQLPSGQQSDPPHPLSSRVHLETFPKSRVLVLQFSKYADEQEWKEETMELLVGAKLRAETGVDYSNVYYATYDLPQKFWGRRNEVWLRQAVPDGQEGPPDVRLITDAQHV